MAYQNFLATKLKNDIGASDTSIELQTAPTATAGRLVLEARNPTQREIVKYTGLAGTTITGVLRGQGGTSAKSHVKNSLVEMNLTAEDVQDLYDSFATAVLQPASITTPLLADGAVTSRKTTLSYGESSWNLSNFTLNSTLRDIPDVTMDITVDYPAIIYVNFFASITHEGTAASLNLMIDGSSIMTQSVQNPSGLDHITTAVGSKFHPLDTGTHTVKLRASRGAGGSGSIGNGRAKFTYILFAQ